MTIKILSLPGMPAQALAELSRSFEVITVQTADDVPAQLGSAAPEVRGIVCGVKGPVDDALLAALPNVEIVFCFGAGLDGIDTVAAERRNVLVQNTSPALADSVADLAMALLLALARGIIAADRHTRDDRWPTSKPPFGMLLAGKKVGILGLGTIGDLVARRAEAFGMKVGYHNRSRRAESAHRYFDQFGDLVDWCDVLIVCASGGPSNRNLINAEILGRLGAQGYLVNISRGSIVDENDLADALETGVIAGAGLDVYQSEPRVPERLRNSPRTVLSPHMGSSTNETLSARCDYMHRRMAEYFSISTIQSQS